MTIKQVEDEIRKLAQLAVLEGWGDYEIREACTATGENFHYFLPVKCALLKKAIRAIESGQAKIASEYN